MKFLTLFSQDRLVVRLVCFCILTVMATAAGLTCSPALAEEAALSAAVRDTLADLDAVFDDSYDWWGRVHDPETGGCYYSASAKAAAAGDSRFRPDIESTQKLVAVMEWTDLLADAPPAFKQGVVAYLLGRQDPESGFFLDPQHIDSYSANARQRATAMAVGTLERCGGRPAHPLPIDRLETNAQAAAHYAMLESPAALRAWLDALPWDTRMWTTGARLRAHAGTFRQLDEPRRSELLNELKRYIEARQRDDGFLGSDTDPWYSRLSGTYKIASFFEINGLPIPRPPAMADTLDELLRTQEFRNTILLYNTANLWGILYRSGVELDPAERIDIVGRCTDLLTTLRAPTAVL